MDSPKNNMFGTFHMLRTAMAGIKGKRYNRLTCSPVRDDVYV